MLWLDKHRIPIGEVDHGVLSRFRRHDCRCPGMEGQRRRMLEADSRRFMTGALRLVRFLEDEGRIGHPGELEDNLEHLDAFLDRCAAQGYPYSCKKFPLESPFSPVFEWFAVLRAV